MNKIAAAVSGAGAVAGVIVSITSSDNLVRAIAGGAAVVLLAGALWFLRGVLNG